MQQAKVSILIPLYNAEKYIAETICSVLAQTWKNIEIIVVDDHSTDNSFEIAKDFESDMVKIFKNPRKGACAARNFAFEKSTGDYIQYLDADDLIPSQKLEKQLVLISEKDHDTLLFCSWSHFFNSLEDARFQKLPIYHDYEVSSDLLIDMLDQNLMLTNHAYLVPRKIIEIAGQWNEDLLINQDGEFFARVILASKSIKYCPDVMVYYRQIPNSGISRSIHNYAKAQSELQALNSIEAALQKSVAEKPKANRVMTKNFSYFVFKYISFYPDLAAQVKQKIETSGVRISYTFFDSKFKYLVLLIGFWNAIQIHDRIKRWTKN